MDITGNYFITLLYVCVSDCMIFLVLFSTEELLFLLFFLTMLV